MKRGMNFLVILAMSQISQQCAHVCLSQLLNVNTKQTSCKKTWDALERTRLQDFRCPRWRAQLSLVPAPAYIRIWLPILPDRVLKDYGQIFRTRPNLVRPWASNMEHIYGAITHQFDSIYAVEGRNGARLIVYQDRDIKQLNVFWPLFYYSQGQDQHREYALKLDYLETRWASLHPSYVTGGRKKPPHYTKPLQRACACSCHGDEPCECHCHKKQPCDCHCHQEHLCQCHCHRAQVCHCQAGNRVQQSPVQRCSCLCHLHDFHCERVQLCQCRCHKNAIREMGWNNDF